eukprot:7553729-Pyramimonas_sp.AAC.1
MLRSFVAATWLPTCPLSTAISIFQCQLPMMATLTAGDPTLPYEPLVLVSRCSLPVPMRVLIVEACWDGAVSLAAPPRTSLVVRPIWPRKL